MAIETVDGLELVISAKSQDAADSIRNLSASVTSFGKEIGKYVHGLQTFAEAIRTISDAAKGLSGIKNIRSIASSVTGAVSRAKTNVAGKQFRPAIPPVRGSYTVTGSNRLVNWKGQGIRRFDKTADDVAREMNRDLGGTRYNNKELSAQIQAIRQNAITGKDVMDEIEALARDLTGTAGSRNKSGLVSMLNSKFGKQYIGVTEKDLKGTGMTISAMNELARSQGGTFGFHMNGDSAKIRGLDEVEESLLKAFGVETAHVEDLIKALETNANVYSGHREQLDAMMADDDASLFGQVFNNLLSGVIANQKVEENKPAEAAKAAAETGKAVREALLGRGVTQTSGKDFFGMFNDRMGIGRTPMSAAESAKVFEQLLPRQPISTAVPDWYAAYKPRPGIRTFEEYDESNAREATISEAEFNRRLSEIIGREGAADRIRESTRRIYEEFQTNGGLGSNAAEAEKVEESISAAKEKTEELAVSARYTAEEFANSVGKTDILQMKLDGVGAALEEALNSDAEDPKKIAHLTEEYKNLKQKIKEAGEEAEKSAPKISMAGVGKAIGKTIERSIFGQLARVARMRGLRAIVKGAANAFKEGIGNMYQWSKGLGGDFAAALDTAASKTMLMKNSIAAALSPALQALVPLLSTVANWVRDVSNAVSQFFALLTGQDTWTMATETAEEWAEKTKKGATGAGKAMKDLLADWDELNIIQGQSGGGGGSSTEKKVADYANMFKEMSVFDEWTHQFDEIRDAVIAIGAGIAGWFAISSVEDFLGKIGIAGDTVSDIFSRIKKGVTGAILLTVGFELSQGAGRSYANNGFTWGAFAENVIGAIASGLGGGVLATTFGINPVVGVALGLGLSVFATIRGFELEQTRNAQNYIRDRLEAEVFHFDVNAVAEEVEVTVGDANRARKEVREQLTRALQTVNAIELGMDSDKTWATLYGQIAGADGLLSRIQTELSSDANVLTMYYSLSEKMGKGLNDKDEQGNYKNLEAFKIDYKANEWLQDEYTRLGEQFASCFVEGEKGKIAEGKEELALAIAKQIAEAERAAEEARGEAQASIAMTDMLKGTDAKHVLENFGTITDEYENKIAEARKSALEGYIITEASTLAQLEKLGADDSLIEAVRANLKAAQDELKNTDFKAQVHLEYADKEKKMLQDFIRDNVSEITGWDKFKNRTLTGAVQTSMTPDDLIQRWGWQLYGAANTALGLDFNSTVLKDFGISLSDILGDDIEEALAELAEDRFGPEGGAAVMSGLGFNEMEMDAKTSGLAEDSTVASLGQTMQAVGQAATESYTRQEGFLRNIMNGINQLGNRPIQVNIGASSGLGRIGGRSGRMLDNITNMDQ